MDSIIEELLTKPYRSYIDSIMTTTTTNESKRNLPSLEGFDTKSRRTNTPIAPILTNNFLTEREKDVRTVFCRQLARSLTEEELISFFQLPIRTVKFVIDKVTLKHRGMAYVEFAEEDMVDTALENFNGKKLKGIPIIIERWISRKPQAPLTQSFLP